MRVLVVEDEQGVAIGIRRCLTAEGAEVEVASDGALGLELGRSGRYDVILLDVMLPKVNGYEVCRTLRREGCTSVIIMLSAKSGDWDVAEGLELGADDYLTKPFSMVVLLARIQARVRDARARGYEGGIFSSGDLRFDPVLRRCWRGNVPIELTGRECSLLTLLFQHIGEVVTRVELLQKAWGDTGTAQPNAIEVVVGRLRRKIDAPFAADDIETIRGVGYRLRPRNGSA